MKELTYRQSEAPDVIHVIGYEGEHRFTVTIKVSDIVDRTVGEASWRKGRRVEPYHGNIVTTVAKPKEA